MRPPAWQRLRTAVSTLVVAGLASGCAGPYQFSPRLDTYLPPPGQARVETSRQLAGNLDLALAALMDQRQMLWAAAGDTERMKNATAIGLIGLGAVGLYRGLQGTESASWLQRAGLLAGATYAGATWLEPDARQKVYLQGALSLTCLALTTAAYEMPAADYKDVRVAVDGARQGLEELASALRLAGKLERGSSDWWLFRDGWNKLRWASGVLANADKALGNIEKVGPRLRDETAWVASEVARQVNRVSKDLSQVSDAIAQIKPQATLLLGAEFSAPPARDKQNDDPPGASAPATDSKSAAKDDDCKADTPKPSDPPAPAAGTSTENAQVALAAAHAASAASAADRAQQAANRSEASARAAQAAAGAAMAPAPASSAAAPYSLRSSLTTAMKNMDRHLGKVVSFVERTAAARNGISLPAGCGPVVSALLPADRSIVLRPRESFQFVMKGDTGRLGVDVLGVAAPRGVLDIAMPMAAGDSTLRLTAGASVESTVNLLLRISDSQGKVSQEISVKVCRGPAP